MKINATFQVKTLNSVPADVRGKGTPAADVIKCVHVEGAEAPEESPGIADGPDGYSELRLQIENPRMLGVLKVGARLRVEIDTDA